jgi:hypothetical protein
MSVFLCLKAALTEPTMLSLAFQFHVSTATWLVHMTTDDKQATFSDLVFPLPESVPECMSCIPELVAENLMDFLLFLRRYKDSVYEVRMLLKFLYTRLLNKQLIRTLSKEIQKSVRLNIKDCFKNIIEHSRKQFYYVPQ